MAESMKDSCKLGVAAYATQAREQWVLEWPGQVVLAVSAIFWTAAVTTALKNGIPGVLSVHPSCTPLFADALNVLSTFFAFQIKHVCAAVLVYNTT